MAALTAGRPPGGFTLEATGAARRAIAPELSVADLNAFFENEKSLFLGLPPLLSRAVQTQLAHARERRAAPPAERADHDGATNAIIAALLGRALRRCEVAALTDGRCSGGFTLEATAARTRHANMPGLSV